MSKGKYLGLDYGDRRVGMAISDENKEISFPRDYIQYTQESELLKELAEFCKEEDITKIILGMPIQMDGSMGERTKKTHDFYESLKKIMPSMKIEFFDERLSTQFAIKNLQGQGIKAKNQKGNLDTASAQIILQNYLNSLSQ